MELALSPRLRLWKFANSISNIWSNCWSNHDIDIQAEASVGKCVSEQRFYARSTDYASFYATKCSQARSNVAKRRQV